VVATLAFAHVSRIQNRIITEYHAAQRVRSVGADGKPTMLLVGNSLLLEGLDLPKTQAALAPVITSVASSSNRRSIWIGCSARAACLPKAPARLFSYSPCRPDTSSPRVLAESISPVIKCRPEISSKSCSPPVWIGLLLVILVCALQRVARKQSGNPEGDSCACLGQS
jgi:hypothetical protein